MSIEEVKKLLNRQNKDKDITENPGSTGKSGTTEKPDIANNFCFANNALTYSSSGVDLDAAGKAVKLIKQPVFSTFNENVLNDLTSYAGLFRLDTSRYKEPVLVSSTDGVGTKLLVAKSTGNFNTIGQDLVAMCINDIICCGATPLFFLDYIAWGKLDPAKAELIVGSIAESCIKCKAALIGGEMAEMPDMYAEDDIDLAGFAVGVVEKSEIIKPDLVRRGDTIIGIPSSGVHSNGFSLVRKIINLKRLKYNERFVPLQGKLTASRGAENRDIENQGIENRDIENREKQDKNVKNRNGKKEPVRTLGDVLIEPTRLYFPLVDLLKEKAIKASGIAHITGGGFYENINRIIPPDTDATISEGSWPIPDIFSYLEYHGNIARDEMYRVFNMGIGLVLILPPDAAGMAIKELNNSGQDAFVIGKVTGGGMGRVIINYKK